ncbi:hypothetical protein [Kordiimonas laminariae]|uniref:hypothetical protein n=1 Tax=Kordiimonas laminariae TaxID=2917717 RepID=UPI001FF4220A|nr:hypothetical protein [Kordiimonas laminariae]MCK0068858.1 hypothetical protein [Kordiimonas laminariae]
MTRQPIKKLLRWAALPVGGLVFIVGAITFPLPLPTGLILMVVGIAIACINPLVLRWVKRKRKNFPETNEKLRKAEPHLPAFLRRFLRRTDTRNKRDV